ncbi:MAG: response regulator transcription factor [Balneolaceae bacterium]|nr:response regulator transcription factor [Balneolaceae bacterium]
MKKIKVILADDHAILRYGISTFLSSSDDVEVVGEASTGDACINLFKDKAPDVCVIDISMPGKSGIQVAKIIRSVDPKAKILILSMYSDKAILKKALKANINGYLLKSTSKEKILDAIRTVARGQKVFSDAVLKIIDDHSSGKNATNGENSDRNITDREREILKLVVAGYSSPQIAEKLFISPRTVDTHRNNLMQKLDIHNTASLVRFALENDLVSGS